jgi:hypothetical protein
MPPHGEKKMATDGILIDPTICDAILSWHLISYRHAPTGEKRTAEPHAYGALFNGEHAVWGWRVEGRGKTPIEPQALELVPTTEMRDVQILRETFDKPQLGYMRANKHMRHIFRQL